MQTGIKPLWLGIGILVLSAAGCSLFGPKPTPTFTPLPPTRTSAPLPSVTPTATKTPYHITITDRQQVTPAAVHSPTWWEFRSYNAVWDMTFAPDGSLWTLADADVVHWDPATGEAMPFPIPAGSEYLHSLEITSDGDLWLATRANILRYNDDRWITYTLTSDPESGQVSSLAVGPGNQVWATNGEVVFFRFDGQNWVEQGLATNKNIVDIYGLVFTPNGELWGHSISNIYHFDGKKWDTYGHDEIGIGSFFLPLAAAPDNSIWVGTTEMKAGGQGAAHFDGKTWTVYRETDGLADNNVTAIAVSPDNSVWFGSWESGISRFDGKSWTVYTAEDGLPDNDIKVIAVAPDGAVWAGTRAGPARFDGRRWQAFSAQGLAGYITSAKVAQDGAAWFLTTGAGISHFDGSRWVNYTRADGLNSCYIQAIAIAPNGTVWAASDRGSVLKLTGQRWQLFAEKIGGRPNEIWALAAGSDGSLWLATSQGILRLNGLDETILFAEDGSVPLNGKDRVAYFPNRQFDSLGVAADGSVWAAAGDGEIYRYDGENWQAVLKTDRGDIYPAPDGAIWIPDGEELNRIVNGERVINSFYGYIQSVFTVPDGSVWVILENWGQGDNGVFRFDGQNWEEYTFDHIVDGYTAGPISNPAQAVWLEVDGRMLALVNP